MPDVENVRRRQPILRVVVVGGVNWA